MVLPAVLPDSSRKWHVTQFDVGRVYIEIANCTTDKIDHLNLNHNAALCRMLHITLWKLQSPNK